MQRYLRLTAIGLTLGIITTTATANSTTNIVKPQTKTLLAAATPATSSTDFSNLVKSLSQQSKDRLSQQTSDALPKPAPSTSGRQAPTQDAAATPATVTTTSGYNQQGDQQNAQYNGFGTGKSTNSNTGKPAAPAKSGGWQIQY